MMSAFPTANPAPSERRLTGGTLFLLAGLAALGALATNIILPAFPRIGAELAISSPELGLLLSSFFVAFALGQLVVGPLSDRFGRKPLVLGGLAVFVAGSVVCALAGTLPLVVLGRVIQALGACAASVLSRAIARDLFDGEALGRALALPVRPATEWIWSHTRRSMHMDYEISNGFGRVNASALFRRWTGKLADASGSLASSSFSQSIK
jgi:DHA1 family bicyclomycin/chloramphenicol resistance-like MFS transporter